MKFFLTFFCCFIGCSVPEVLEDGREIVEPEYLFSLLKEKNYEEFNRLTAIENPIISMPRDENDKTDPRYSHHLENGDFLLTPQQKEVLQSRNAINAAKYPSYRWKNRTIHYAVDPNTFTTEERNLIHKSAAECTKQFGGCMRLVHYYDVPPPRPQDYVSIISGSGCWSYMGRIGGQQAMSLQNTGCLSTGTICHEFMHACGFAHEQSREDRDDNLIMNWQNINQGWESQFDKACYDDYVLYLSYDYCSVMHYPRYHPDLCKPGTAAFDYKVPSAVKCNHTVGYAPRLSELDKQKICMVYANNG